MKHYELIKTYRPSIKLKEINFYEMIQLPLAHAKNKIKKKGSILGDSISPRKIFIYLFIFWLTFI